MLEKTELMVFLEESRKKAAKVYDFYDYCRSDPFYQNAYKIRISQVVPEQGYQVDKCFYFRFEKDCRYMLKAYERDGSVAWSSPVWIRHSLD